MASSVDDIDSAVVDVVAASLVFGQHTKVWLSAVPHSLSLKSSLFSLEIVKFSDVSNRTGQVSSGWHNPFCCLGV